MGKLRTLLALLLAFTLVAAACGGGSDDSSDGGDDTDTTENEEDSGPATTVKAETEETDAAAGGPVRGGTIVYGMEADSANPWAPYRVSCAISCYTVLQTVSDPLFQPVESGGVKPYLAESAEPNADYTEWVFTIRDGITFHDGTPLDGEAVAFNINTCRGSGLTGPALANIGDITADGQTVTFTMNAPWVPFPENLSIGQCAFMFSPTWLASLDDVPFRNEGTAFYSEEVAATPGGGDPAAPVGVGAFQFESFSPGNANKLIATRYEDYWRGPNGITGEELPYLDQVELVVAVDIASRSDALASGEFDIIHTANADEIARFTDDDGFSTITASDFGETSHILLNSAQGENPTFSAINGLDAPAPMDPEGSNAESPLRFTSCRRALAFATDQQRIADERYAGIVEVANGPFPPGAIGYLEDTGYPTYDLDAAAEEWTQCKADTGKDLIQFTFNTTNDPFNVETNTLIQSMWSEAFGDEIQTTVTPVEQGQYIGLALTGTFEAFGWRNHGGIDPDNQFLWWFSGTSSPIGTLALNFGRFQDPIIDQNLVAQRSTDDPAARQAAAEAVNQQFGAEVYNLWTVWTLWGVISNPNVQGLGTLETPEGEATRSIVSGRHYLTNMWCTEGDCQG